ncbi:MAG: pantoate--beta-alanine ligase [Bacteroidales bacterium]|nr:pantoate--beta-alanine ligase [Bacteroidales bacterium]MBQ1719286.1 pantoate--beta-alanine ligase [Bacteroidales bacterium]MBQ2077503.1 pantoate--beta-alanine ligase [Bacteroidales bacterium]MBQ2543061.1 pantoate--beta-alanine ligase [Bacteroidales bacterium]
MKIVRTVDELTALRNDNSFKGKRLGFVPTMGALHEGHASLIRRSVAENDCTVVSVFVNPRQFNDPNDYKNYPITTDADIALLESVKCDILYLPTADDIYNGYDGCKMDFHGLDRMYEGEFRPGHFQGVVDIVYRLFDLVKPDFAYFGEKDFQQVAIIKLMVKQKNLPLTIVPCPIVREESGLAKSSRNKLLTAEQLEVAPQIYRIITETCAEIPESQTPDALIETLKSKIDSVKFMKMEYAAFCNSENLELLSKFDKKIGTRLCIAVWCGNIRLIDNINCDIK